MGLIRKIKASLLDDWCGQCQIKMSETFQQLYTLPMTVGHYSAHKEAEYYRRSLRPVAHRADIPPGVYACRVSAYRCPDCGRRLVKVYIFLPVREQDKYEDSYLFEHGELDDFIWGRQSAF